jgi:ubiquitin C-terminal hydrolase
LYKQVQDSSGPQATLNEAEKLGAKNLLDKILTAEPTVDNLRTKLHLKNLVRNDIDAMLPFTTAVTGCSISTVTCTIDPGHTSATRAIFTTLELPLQNSTGTQNLSTLNGCIQNFLTPERMEGKNQWRCEQCIKRASKKGKEQRKHSYVDATKVTTFSQLPLILIIQLHRFKKSETSGAAGKLTHSVAYNDKLEIQDIRYTLKTVIHHHGTTLAGGHYTVTVLDSKGEWRNIETST